jgi:hypothetical protein
VKFVNFERFLKIAQEHAELIIALCAEQGLISRSMLLNYLEHQHIAPGEKEPVIQILCKTEILIQEAEQSYTVNPVVVDVVNHYERRGRLMSATFLSNQIHAISDLTDKFHHQLATSDTQPQVLFDTLDDLYRLVREVRDAGNRHYIACMRLFGDMKRAGETKTIEQRVQALRDAQRRHITPLRDLIDPEAMYAHKLRTLRYLVTEFGARQQILVQSQELESRRQRLLIDLHYIDHVLLRNFGVLEQTALRLLQAVLDEKHIKDAVAACLGDLEATWTHLADRTIYTKRQRVYQAMPLEDVGMSFAEVIHRRLLPQPQPLYAPEVEQINAERLLIRQARIWRDIRAAGNIASWPAFVVQKFASYPPPEQLQAIVLPLTMRHPQVEVARQAREYVQAFDGFSVRMQDFSVQWRVQS